MSFPGVITVYEKAWVAAPVPPAGGWSDEEAFAAARARCVSTANGADGSARAHGGGCLLF